LYRFFAFGLPFSGLAKKTEGSLGGLNLDDLDQLRIGRNKKTSPMFWIPIGRPDPFPGAEGRSFSGAPDRI